MARGTIDKTVRRGIADFAFALALFWAIALAWGGNHSKALAVSPASLTSEQIIERAAGRPAVAAAASNIAARALVHDARAARRQALWLLSLTLAGIIALNLAFWRHLRRVYASPRRGVWRRG